MTVRYDDQPTQEMDRSELDALIAQSERMGYAPEPAPQVIADPPPTVLHDGPDPIEAIDAAAAEVAIDLPLDDDGSDAGFTATAVDPRFAARREDVATERRRARRRRLALMAAAPVVGAAIVLSLYSPLLDVDRIDVIGSDAFTAADISQIGGLSIGDPIVMTSMSDVENRLNADPRIERVSVQRRWPNAVTVRVSERRALFVLDADNGSFLIGEGGMVMRDATPEDFVGRIKVETTVETAAGERLPDALAAAVEVLTRWPLSVGWNIRETLITAEGELIFTMTDDTVVVFGTVEDADAKVQSVVTMLTSNVDLSGVCRIDVRVPASPTVRRAPQCELPERPRDAAARRSAEAHAAAQAAKEAAELEALTAAESQQAGDVGADHSSQPIAIAGTPPAGQPAPAPVGDPNTGGILTPPEPAGHATGDNLEPGADGIQ